MGCDFPKRVLLLAGEESGLIYARGIAAELRARCSTVEIRGYADYGFETGDLAVMGFWPVLKRLFFFLRVKRTLEKAIREWQPTVVCTVDYPGMNLKLAAYAKQRGIRAVHVVCPQVWAWRKGRIPKIEAALDHLCCFFPFEPKLFRSGFAEFVGHPLAEAMAIKNRPTTRFPASDEERLLAVLPGSRLGEIERILPTLLAAIRDLPVRVVIPAANARAEEAIRRILREACLPETVRLTVQCGGAREVLLNATCAVVASGTATLEAALARCPTVLVYRVSPFLACFARCVIKEIRHVGLANVIAEKEGIECPMPELLQEDLTAEHVRAHILPWLTDENAHAHAVHLLDKTMAYLSSEEDSMTKIAQNLI